jgi:hypothetical protein
LTIFGEKIGVFLKKQCYDQNFELFAFVLSHKRHFFRKKNLRKYLKNHNIGPWTSDLRLVVLGGVHHVDGWEAVPAALALPVPRVQDGHHSRRKKDEHFTGENRGSAFNITNKAF